MSRSKSFPVGKVDFLDLYPLTFYEFLSAVGEERYREYLENLERIEPIPSISQSMRPRPIFPSYPCCGNRLPPNNSRL